MASNKPVSTTEALRRLAEGNRRFIEGRPSSPNDSLLARRAELADKGQRPFAIIVTCSDSRVPPELLFDQGLGDLFVVRAAGNIVTPELLAGIEFAALSFETRLCIVLGHTECGAVRAATRCVTHGEPAPTPALRRLIQEIRPAVERVRTALSAAADHDLVPSATVSNIFHGIDRITAMSPLLQDRMANGEFEVVGALYELHSGRVNFELGRSKSVLHLSSIREGDRSEQAVLSQ